MPSLVCSLLVTGILVGGGSTNVAAALGNPADGPVYRRITFPVNDTVSYTDTFGACRDGCTRTHEGQDLMGRKLMPLVAAVDGTVAWVHNDGAGRAGNMVSIQDARGWQYYYIHINNDTPGTDDGANPSRWAFASGIVAGAPVRAGQLVAYMGDSGNAEWSSPHLHFEIHRPDGTVINPWTSLRLSQGLSADPRCDYDTNPRSRPSKVSGPGYWVASPGGAVFAYGRAKPFGGMSRTHLAAPIIGLAPTPTAAGYWLLGRDGGIFSFGDARFHGSTGAMKLNAPIIGMAATTGGKGYWLVGGDGGVFSFGDAKFYGSTGDRTLGASVSAIAATPTGKGYWLTDTRGRVYAFGDARRHGGAASMVLDHPVVGIVTTPSAQGYWLYTSDGRVLPYGDATWAGEVRTIGLCSPSPARAMVSTRTGRGYWMLQADGRVRSYGDAYPWGEPASVGTPGAAMAGIPRVPAA